MTYKIKTKCRNCGEVSELEVERGVRIEEDAIGRLMTKHQGVVCNNCGCCELERFY